MKKNIKLTCLWFQDLNYKIKSWTKIRFENGFDKKRKVIVGQTSYKLRNKGKT